MVELVANIVNNKGVTISRILGINKNRVVAGSLKYIDTFINDNNINKEEVESKLSKSISINIVDYYKFTRKLGDNRKLVYRLDTNELSSKYIIKSVGKQLYKSMLNDIKAMKIKEETKQERVNKYKRTTINNNINCLLDRAKQINKNDNYLYNVDKVIVIGDYVSSDRSNINIAVDVSPKEGITQDDLINYGNSKTTRETRYSEDILWALKDTVSHLKARKKSLPINISSLGGINANEYEQRVLYQRT